MDRHARQTPRSKYIIQKYICHKQPPKWRGSVNFPACLPIFFIQHTSKPLYTKFGALRRKWRSISHIRYTIMSLYDNSLFGILCMCAWDIYMCVCVRKHVCVNHIRVCIRTWALHMYMPHPFTCWCFLCVCMYVLLIWNVCYFIVGK